MAFGRPQGLRQPWASMGALRLWLGPRLPATDDHGGNTVLVFGRWDVPRAGHFIPELDIFLGDLNDWLVRLEPLASGAAGRATLWFGTLELTLAVSRPGGPLSIRADFVDFRDTAYEIAVRVKCRATGPELLHFVRAVADLLVEHPYCDRWEPVWGCLSFSGRLAMEEGWREYEPFMQEP